jgi:hypothetical protein
LFIIVQVGLVRLMNRQCRRAILHRRRVRLSDAPIGEAPVGDDFIHFAQHRLGARPLNRDVGIDRRREEDMIRLKHGMIRRVALGRLCTTRCGPPGWVIALPLLAVGGGE